MASKPINFGEKVRKMKKLLKEEEKKKKAGKRGRPAQY